MDYSLLLGINYSAETLRRNRNETENIPNNANNPVNNSNPNNKNNVSFYRKTSNSSSTSDSTNTREREGCRAWGTNVNACTGGGGKGREGEDGDRDPSGGTPTSVFDPGDVFKNFNNEEEEDDTMFKEADAYAPKGFGCITVLGGYKRHFVFVSHCFRFSFFFFRWVVGNNPNNPNIPTSPHKPS